MCFINRCLIKGFRFAIPFFLFILVSMKPIQALCTIQSGKLSIDRKALNEAIQSCEDGYYWLTIQSKHRGRSGQQNAYYWGVVVEAARLCMSEHEGQDVDAEYTHELLKYHLNPCTIQIGEKSLTLGGSTSKMSTVEFSDYVAKCREWVMDMFSVYVQEPNEKVL